MNDQLLKYEEPESHHYNKGIIESIFGFFIPKINYDLSKSEIQNFRELQNSLNDPKINKIVPFDQNDPLHNKFITSLYYELTEQTISDSEIEREFWIRYGFQQANPRTDFRGAGVAGAKHLLYFVENNRDLVERMTQPENNFYMAINSIKVSDFLLKFFHMPFNLNYKEDHESLCSRKSLKNFCRILKREELILEQMHSIVLTHLFWNHILLMKNNSTQQFLTISDKQRFQATKNKFSEALDAHNIKSIAELEEQFWGKSKIEMLKMKKMQ